MQDLKNKIQDSVKQAMKSQEKARLATLRMIAAAIKQQEVDQRIELTDLDVIQILVKMVKQRNESILQFQSAGREDLVVQETSEISIIKEFLPQQLSEKEIHTAVITGIAALEANSIKDMNKVMQYLRKSLVGVVDFEQVGALVKDLLLNGPGGIK